MPLCFVDRDCKCQSNWELQSLKLKWHIGWNHWNSRLRTSSLLKGPVKIFASMMLFIFFIFFFYWKTCAIAKLGLVNISRHDKIFIKQQNKWDINDDDKFKNKFFRIKINLLTPTKYGLNFINERKLFKEWVSLKLNNKK